MTEDRFYELLYDQYKEDLAAADTLYQRAGVVLAGQVVIAGFLGYLARSDWFARIDESTTVLLYYILLAGAMLCLTVAGVYLILALWPRSYPRLTNLQKWVAWRDAHSKSEEEFRDQIVRRMLEAQAEASSHNLVRGKQFLIGIAWTCAGIGGGVVTAMIHIVLSIQEILR